MRNVHFVLKILVTAVLVAVFGVLIVKDFAVVKKIIADNPLSVGLQAQRERVKTKAMLVTINHYRPDLSQWRVFMVEGIRPSERFLRDNVYYYELITGYFPEMAEAYHMLALSHYLLEEREQALRAQLQAARLMPRFFAGQYNLGLMLYEQGRWAQAVEVLAGALRVRPQDSLRVVTSSRIFAEIIHSSQTRDMLAPGQVEGGYRNAAILLDACARRSRGQLQSPAAEGLRAVIF